MANQLVNWPTNQPAKWLCKLLATIVLQIGQFIALLLLRVSSAASLHFFAVSTSVFPPLSLFLFYLFPLFLSLNSAYSLCLHVAVVVVDFYNCKFNHLHDIKLQVEFQLQLELESESGRVAINAIFVFGVVSRLSICQSLDH